ncbi:MAG: dockerin type I domain-containing protein, partial [Phycisphaerales bacterium]
YEGTAEDCLVMYQHSGKWNDGRKDGSASPVCVYAVMIEWSADCNADGIVDYGQILQGQLPDTNTNGIPDGCECATSPTLPACCTGDLNQDRAVDGADLGILLNAWGTCNGVCPADLNRDGFVNGSDLGMLLGRWGMCS